MQTTKRDFRQDVLSAFAPIDKFGFQCTQLSEETIALETDNVLMHVHYDHKRSFEVGVEVSLKGDHPDLEVYSLRDVFRETGVPDADSQSVCQTQDYNRAMAFLKRVAELLISHAKLVLAGDVAMFQRLEDRQSREAANYTLQVQLDGIRSKAKQAWKDQRLQEYVDLLEGFETLLPESERKKLDYASKKLRGN